MSGEFACLRLHDFHIMENWRRKLGNAPVHTIKMFLHSETVMKIATNFGREKLLSLGTCVGKFTKTDRFMLSITFLDYLSQYAKVRHLDHFISSKYQACELSHPFVRLCSTRCG